MVRTLKPAIATVDARTVKPAPKTADAELLTPEHRAWREVVIVRAGFRCQAIEKGQRCTVSAPARLFADHIQERSDGGAALDPANGQCLCGRHHTIKTNQARRARMQERW